MSLTLLIKHFFFLTVEFKNVIVCNVSDLVGSVCMQMPAHLVRSPRHAIEARRGELARLVILQAELEIKEDSACEMAGIPSLQPHTKALPVCNLNPMLARIDQDELWAKYEHESFSSVHSEELVEAPLS